jgi:hypothetical protein
MVFIRGFLDGLAAMMPERRPKGERSVRRFPWYTGRNWQKRGFAAV